MTTTRYALFTGSSPGTSDVYADHAAALATDLATRGIGVVYGGAQVGLMGVIADAALKAGGEVFGVIPRSMVDREIAHPGLTRLDVVTTMHERKARMADLCDAFVALPGGAGTLDEFFEAWTWLQIGVHAKPVALYDIAGYWTPLLAALDTGVEAGFIRAAFRDALIVADTPTGLVEQIEAWRSPATAWE